MIRFLLASLLLSTAAGAGILETTSPTGLCDTVKQLSGYFKLAEQKKNYFYWFFEARNDPATAPLVLWLTGGPGCSSEVALFGENGPCKVQEDLSTKTNPNSWNTNANLLYIDQPAGTGFSYGSHDTNEKEVGDDMYDFLQEFIKANPQYTKTQEFYVFGESYAGHYVPAITHRIYMGNKALKSGDVNIPLKGLAIGNGLTDPEIQYSKYPEMACDSGTAPHVPGFSNPNSGLCAAMKAAVPGCVKDITECNEGHTLDCGAAYLRCNESLVTPVELSGINLYDLREKCEHPPLCYDFSLVDKFLKQDKVKEALGVKGHSWSSCNHLVTIGFLADWMKNYQTELPDMLAAGINVLIYAGDQDYICNWLGNKAWTMALPWSGKDAFNSADDKDWMVSGKAAGKARTVKNFTFLQVFQAGHMVPRDQPVNALSMMETFVMGKSFAAPTELSAIETAAIATDALQFLEGAAEEIAELNGAQLQACIGDGSGLLEDLDAMKNDFSAGFAKKDKSKFEDGLVMFSDAIADVLHIAQDCGIATLGQKLEPLIKTLAKKGGWKILLKEEVVTIFKDHVDITADVKAIVADFESKNFKGAGEEFGKIINVMLSPSKAPAVVLTFIGEQPIVESFAAGTAHYEDPNTTGSCQSGEVDVQIQGIKGKMCAPKCSSTGTCPTDVPSGVTAKPTCALQGMGGKYCALVCSPSTQPSMLRAGDAQCGANASCKAISGTGICTYDK